MGKWSQILWQQRKLSHETYERYTFLCCDGMGARKRNLDIVRQWEDNAEEDAEREATGRRVRQKTFVPFPEIPEVTAWLALFKEEVDRYPFLVILGPSRSRKTEMAKALFKAPLELKVGWLTQIPDRMRTFSRKKHDAIVFDDLRDFQYIVDHQEKFQGKSDAQLEFGTTAGGQCAYTKWLHRVPVVVTANNTTKNAKLLDTDDFLGDHRVLVRLAGPLQNR